MQLEIVLKESQQVLLVAKPGWIQAWQCRCWLAAYQSPLVKPESKFYKPVADALAAARQAEVVHHELVDDPAMMFGQAHFKLWRLK